MKRHTQHSRRGINLVAAALFSAAAGAATMVTLPAEAADRQVKMLLDWIHNGPNSGFVIAKEKGFYKSAGLDVSIEPGKGSGSTAQLIASKVADFGFSDGYVVASAVGRGMDIKMVAGVFRRNPTAVIALQKSGITTAKQLEGKTIGIATGAAQFQQWPAYVGGCKLDNSKIKIVNIDPAGYIASMMAGQVDAVAGFAQGMVPGLEVRAKENAQILWYADCGVTTVSNGIIAHNDLVKSDPALIKTFVAASLRGFLYGRANPQEAIEILKKYQPNLTPAITNREMEISWTNWVTPNTAKKPLGWMSEDDWSATVKVAKQFGGMTADVKTTQLYTNEFVPGDASFVPPQN
ncbi:MAG: ABC transporter substrate-binding protein [Alphaproteobacteria bacterium]|nr:ABC transporter substrate-binding protein [Alphaproteobacteria bacterium]